MRPAKFSDAIQPTRQAGGPPLLVWDAGAMHKRGVAEASRIGTVSGVSAGSAARVDELFREPNRGTHAGRAGLALAGDVVCRSVTRRGANKRQAQSPVNTGFKADHLQGRETLIVIHRHDDIELPTIGLIK